MALRSPWGRRLRRKGRSSISAPIWYSLKVGQASRPVPARGSHGTKYQTNPFWTPIHTKGNTCAVRHKAKRLSLKNALINT